MVKLAAGGLKASLWPADKRPCMSRSPSAVPSGPLAGVKTGTRVVNIPRYTCSVPRLRLTRHAAISDDGGLARARRGGVRAVCKEGVCGCRDDEVFQHYGAEAFKVVGSEGFERGVVWRCDRSGG